MKLISKTVNLFFQSNWKIIGPENEGGYKEYLDQKWESLNCISGDGSLVSENLVYTSVNDNIEPGNERFGNNKKGVDTSPHSSHFVSSNFTFCSNFVSNIYLVKLKKIS